MSGRRSQLSRLRSNNGTGWGGAISEAANELFAAHRVHFDHQLHATTRSSPASRPVSPSRPTSNGSPRPNRSWPSSANQRSLGYCRHVKRRRGSSPTCYREATDGERWRAEHPEVMHRLGEIGSQIYNLHAAVDSERWTVDKELNPRPEPERSPERSTSYEHSSSIEHDRDYGFGM